jgi:hypothetical protein
MHDKTSTQSDTRGTMASASPNKTAKPPWAPIRFPSPLSIRPCPCRVLACVRACVCVSVCVCVCVCAVHLRVCHTCPWRSVGTFR